MKKGFTLAETMIVLVVIGVLGAILLPVINKANPDGDLLRFKKAHETLLNAVQELAASDKYYLNGDLGIRADGTMLDGSHEGDDEYFCKTLVAYLDIKTSNCDKIPDMEPDCKICFVNIENGLYGGIKAGDELDRFCRQYYKSAIAKEIVLKNGVYLYEPYPHSNFGMKQHGEADRVFHREVGEFWVNHMTFCMDIDGPNKGEEPFAYGIRSDGKMYYGSRVEEWLQRSVIKK